MNRIRCGAILLSLALGAGLMTVGGAAYAQETTGRVTGRVTDPETGAPVGGVTVIVQGPQGEDATITDDKGDYLFTSLTVGTYTVRFYLANAAGAQEQPGVQVSAEKTVRVSAKISTKAQGASQQTYVITGKAPSIDIGSSRVGATFDQDYVQNIPNGRTYGDVLQRAPGAFIDPSGNVSIGGATGLENSYILNGVNVTGMEFGGLESGAPSLGGGTNLPLEFLTQIDVNAGGYQAEFGGAMGGVINTVLKSGSNELKGSAFGYWTPYWLSGTPNVVNKIGGATGRWNRYDFDTNIGVEVGGPLIKDKLFFWVGLAPRFTDAHTFRLTYALQDDGTGSAKVDANGNAISTELQDWRARINETHKVWNVAATVDWVPSPDHKLTVGVLTTPTFQQGVRTFQGFDSTVGTPDWAAESIRKTNTDVTAHWTSKLMDRKWQLEVLAGYHREDFDNYSPTSALNAQNQLEYHNANLWDLEHTPGCEPISGTNMGTPYTFQPCPVDNYHSGGFGLEKKYTGQRWQGEVKSTHQLEAGGHHEIKYGYHLEANYFDQDRYYSGPLGSRGLVQLYPGAMPNYNTYTFFSLPKGSNPVDYGPMGMGAMHPYGNLLTAPDYQDHLRANVKSLSNAFFLQEGYSPEGLRNLTINIGARLELQKMYDLHGTSFLDATNFGPRLGAVYDPTNDGRSKVSVSYGQYFEAIPMNLAARYFGGEGIAVRQGVPLADCAQADPYTWKGNGEFAHCPSLPARDTGMDNAAGGYFIANNGSDYPVQSHLRGQYHNEIVATVARELMEDLTLQVDYIHRWLGSVIEDGATDPNSFTFVLANPGNVPAEALTDAKADVDKLSMTDQTDPRNQSALANAQAKLATLKGLAAAPKPERTYQALMLSVNKRFSKNWYARGSYTYSRLFGNYDGLYQAEGNYFAPNGNNAYDTQDVYANQRGPLPNDRPHLGRVDGYYIQPVGKGKLTFGLSFSGRSGMPRNYISTLLPGNNVVQLLPRGSAGRTPPVTQFDGHIAYMQPLTPTVNVEAFVDLFNLFNQQAALQVDDNYTYDLAPSIVNGTPKDLAFAKGASGQPLAANKNPNFGQPLVYQAPFNTRLGLRLNF